MLLLSLICLVFADLSLGLSPYYDPHFLPNRTGIVHLFEWTFDAIASECEDFLGPKGFAGVQVSPVNENAIVRSRPWYERYQPVSYRIITRSGNEDDFADMVRRCNNAGIRIYVDVIPNHMAPKADSSVVYGTGGSIALPDDLYYPGVPYTSDDFNPQCTITDYSNVTQVRDCELVGLHDLDQSNSHVREEILSFLNNLVDLGVAGFRVDAASHMWPDDLEFIYSNINDLNTSFNFPTGARPFIYQETTMNKDEYSNLGRIVEFAYGYFISSAFKGVFPLRDFSDFGENWGLVSSDEALVFIDNHDTQRQDSNVLTYKNKKLYLQAMAFMFAFPFGVKRILSSYAFTDPSKGPPQDRYGNILEPRPMRCNNCRNGWNCEHRWQGLAEMVQFDIAVAGTGIRNFWGNYEQQATFCRGSIGFVAFNAGSKNMKEVVDACLPSGRYCDVVTGGIEKRSGKPNRCKGKTIYVNLQRQAEIRLSAGDKFKFLAIHRDTRL